MAVLSAQVTVPTPTDLGTLGGIDSDARAINNNGVVVGWSRLANGEFHAFVWTSAQGMSDLGTLGGDYSFATGINDSNIVVGLSGTAGNASARGFVWSETSGMTALGTLGGDNSYAEDISNNGVVVGGSTLFPASSEIHAFMWTESGGMVDLGSLTEPGGSHAFGVNDSGAVVGASSGPDGGELAFLWTETEGMVSLGTLGGTFSRALEINNAGVVVGLSTLPGDSTAHPFMWTSESGMVDLLPSAIGLGHEAYSVNGNGVIVGILPDANGFTWTAADGLVDAGTGMQFQDVNDQFVIVGGADFGDGWRAALWAVSTSNTPTGSNVSVNTTTTLPGGGTTDVSLTFGSVTTSGLTTVTASESGQSVPSGFKLIDPPLFFDVQTTAEFGGVVGLCFSWAEGSVQNESNVRLLHYENSAWEDVTTSVNAVTNVVCGQVTSLSPFAIVELTYEFMGFSPPLLSDGSASIHQQKAGRTIPVKFQLRFGGQLSGTATARIAVYRILNVATGTVDTTDLTEDAGAANENSDRFRYDTGAQHYIYNLNTKGWQAPATYRLIVTLADGSTHAVDFSLR